MSISTTLNRMLGEPNAREVDLLESDLLEDAGVPLEHDAIAANLVRGKAPIKADITHVNTNTDQRFIIVTQDKTLLCLKRNLARLGRKEWIAPLSTVMTILMALLTSDFKDVLGLQRAEWKAIFIVSGFVAAGWLFKSIQKSMNAKSFNEVVSDIVYELGAQRRC